MTLYARHLSPTETMVAAADTMVEIDDLLNRLSATDDGGMTFRLPDTVQMMTEECFAGLPRAPVVIEFERAEDQRAFATAQGIVILKPNALREKAQKMADAARGDVDDNEERTLAEIYGLDKHDPWDQRTEEERALDEAMKKKADEARKKGNMTGESFGGLAPVKTNEDNAEGEPKAPTVRVTDVRLTEKDGDLVVTSAIARQKKVATDPASIPDDERLNIDHKSIIGIYFKVEVVGAKLVDVIATLAAEGMDLPKLAVDLKNNAAGCWAALPRKVVAEEIGEKLTAHGMTVEVYAISKSGQRVTPKGVVVVDEGAEEPEGARPWNDGAAEWDALDEEGRKALMKSTLKAKQFLVAGWYDGPGKGTTVFITPNSFFKAEGRMWEEASLPISTLLPRDLKEIAPGHYHSDSRDWNHMSADLTGRGFIYSIPLQLWLNNQ